MGDDMIKVFNNFKSKNRNGSALAMVIIVFLIVSILLSSVFALSMSNTRQVVAQEQGIHSDYIARSGAEAMFEYLIDSPRLAAYDTWTDPEIDEEVIVFSEGEATVTVEKATFDGRDRVRITSLDTTDSSSIGRKAILEFDRIGYGNIKWAR